MIRRYLLSKSFAISALVFSFAGSAGATQPLDEFLTEARARSFDAREQEATWKQRDWEKDAALGRLLPSFTARGVYTRNQYEAAVTLPGSDQQLVIMPYDQLDAYLQLDVPLVDLANYYRYDQAKHLAKAAEMQKALTGVDLDRAVARSYYTYIGAAALLKAAERSVQLAEENLAFVTTRREAGVATELDQERARANLEQMKQNRVDAEFAMIMAARNLETLSGLTPTPVNAFPSDDLRPEAPLEEWLASQDTPQDRVQKELIAAAGSAKKAAAFSLLPTLSANAQERFTNATGFTGRSAFYTLQAVLSWRLDYATYSTAQAQAAAADVQAVRAERARRGVEDTIFDAYKRVETNIAKSVSARAQADAAEKAAHLARERYEAGALTQLDVTQSQREALSAQAARIQADSELLLSRVVLRVVAGKSASVPPPPTRPLEVPAPAASSASSPAQPSPARPDAAEPGAAPATTTPPSPPPTTEPAPAR